MTFEVNKAGLDKLFADIVKKVESADQRIRATHSGKPASEVEPHARKVFADIGIDLRSGISAYADSVEKNKPFKIEIS